MSRIKHCIPIEQTKLPYRELDGEINLRNSKCSGNDIGNNFCSLFKIKFFDILILLRQFPLLKIFLFIKDYIREIDQNYIQLKVAKTA